jgi:hypothetical protein
VQISIVSNSVWFHWALFFFLEKKVASKLHPSGTTFFGLKKNSYEFLNIYSRVAHVVNRPNYEM